MRANATHSPVRNGKRRLLSSCAIAAGIAALAYGGPALAQVAGAPQVPPVGYTVTTNAGTKTTTVNVGGLQTIINWVPTDAAATGGDINFLPGDSTWNFNGAGNYVVLNRFVNGAGGSLSRQIALNGQVNSTNSAASGARGGSIWFYNAGGLLIGSTGVINVGSLVLTTNDIVTTGGLFDTTTGAIRFRGASGSTAGVTVNGAINANQALNPGTSYVALVAPRVTQAGNVNVYGSAGYVAAEQADIRINGGLFDINVLVGAEGGNVITHTGITTGPEQQAGAAAPAQRIYMVAIPKNVAVGMLVSGQVGYQDGATAAITNSAGSIVLSAGYNVTNGAINTAPVNATAANLTVNDILFRSDVTAHASGAFLGQPLSTLPPVAGPSVPPAHLGRFVVQGSGTFIGDASATLNVTGNRAAGASGTLTVQSGGRGGVPGNASVNVSNGGLLLTLGGLSVLADSQADATTGNARGGNATLSVTGGGNAITNALLVSATGTGGRSASGVGGTGTGGTAQVTVSGVGSQLSATSIAVNASGFGGGVETDLSGVTTASANGGDGFGGGAFLNVDTAGSLTATDGVALNSFGVGEIGTAQSGNGTGGTARVSISGARNTVTTPLMTINATGVGGGSSQRAPSIFTPNGGDGAGGTAELLINTDVSSALSLGSVGLSANAFGGGAGNSENATGGDATGGTVNVSVDGGANVQVSNFAANARADSGSAGSPSGFTGLSGNAQGGNVNITVTGASDLLIDQSATVDVGGLSSPSENVGSGTGGNVAISSLNSSNLIFGQGLNVNAFGGSLSSGFPGTAGSGTGGNVSFLADIGGTISADNYNVDARGNVVNTSGDNGPARGGSITMTALNAGVIESTNDGIDFLGAGAQTGFSANGASAVGGDITLFADEGRIALANPIFNVAGVSGGALGPNSPIPTGTGGNILVRTGFGLGTEISFGSLSASADGSTQAFIEGSGGDDFQPAGDGQGGTITFEINGGTLNAFGPMRLSADGFGGIGRGTTGRGGIANFTQFGGEVNVGALTISADGYGGFATLRSGDGFGGDASLNLLGGTFTGDNVSVSASGIGGLGYFGDDSDPADPNPAGNGGNGQGGNAAINIAGDAVVNTTVLAAYASGNGGGGGDFYSYNGVPGAGGNGGDGRGGFAYINLTSGELNTDSAFADAAGFGGNGGNILTSTSSGFATGAGVGGNGGNGNGGTATIELSGTLLNISESIGSRAIGGGGNGGGAPTSSSSGFPTGASIGGNGGSGTGGLAQAIVDNYDAGTLTLLLDSSAFGGAGGDGTDGDGGRGGDAFGGTSRVEAIGEDAAVIVSQANFATSATGGNGGSAYTDFFSRPDVGGRGGDGGFGTGGTIQIVATDGGTVGIGSGRTGGSQFSSIGTGGDAGRGADNPGTITLPGRDGILGTPDDVIRGLIGGDGGTGGGGTGGTVYFLANGGTITSDGNPVSISVNGISGLGGEGGSGSGGGGSCCGSFVDIGGKVVFEALSTPFGAGQITLGDTTIDASGFIAGRIQMFTDGNITMNSLVANAFGLAAPTNNDTDEALAGIFLAATGGTISTIGDMTLRTGSSVGAYAQAGGQVSAGGNLTIEADDQVDLRHEFRGTSTNATLLAGGSLSISAGSSISGAPGTLLSAGDTLTLATTTVNGNIGVDRIEGGDIVITTAGRASIEHAEADNDFTADVGSFRTGLNSIITGGNIDISAVGTVDLGNSTAGGFVFVEGQSIAFNTVNAGTTVSLRAQGFGANDGIFGTAITAGDTVSLTGRSVGVSGTVQTGGSLFVTANNGNASIGLGNADGNIAIFANNDLTGIYRAGGNVNLRALGNINAEADAAGDYVDANGIASEGYVLVDANGNVTLTNSSAATMIGIRSGGATMLTGATAGEDVFVLAGTGATLSNITAGDDLTVQAGGAISVTNAETTGNGPDNRSVVYASGASSPTPFLQIQTTGADLSNVTLTAPNAGITAANVTAFDNLTANTGAGMTATGTLAAGGNIFITATGAIDIADANAGNFVQMDGASIDFANITAGSSVDLNASGTTAGAEGIRGSSISAGDNVFLNGNSIAIETIEADGFLSAVAGGGNVAIADATVARGIGVQAAGNITGNYAGGEDIFLSADGDIIASARAIGDGSSSSSGSPVSASLYVDAGGDVVLTTSQATGMFGVNAGGSVTLNGATAGEDMLVIAGTTAALTDITAGDDIDIRAAGDITATNVSATGNGPDENLLDYRPGIGFTFMQGEGVSAVDGSDIIMASSGGSIGATNLLAGDDITLFARSGNVNLDGATTLGMGVTAGGSNIRVEGIDATVGDLDAFSDIFVVASGTANVADVIDAGRNVTISGNAVTLADIVSSSQVFDTVAAGGNISITSATDITGGALNAGGNLTLTAAGLINIARGETGDDGAMTLTGATGITADQLYSRGVTTLTSTNGDVRINNLSSFDAVSVSANSLDIGTNGPIEFANIVTDVGDATIRSGNRFIVDNATIAGTARFSNSGEHMIIRSLTAAAADFSGNEMISMTNVSVTGDLNAEAGSIIAIDGVVTGRNISLASADIDIAATGRVGTAGVTEGLEIINNDDEQQTFVGGTGTKNGYHIDAAELARLFGTDIEIFAPEVNTVGGGSVGSSAPPDVVVDTFTMTGGAQGSNLGANGSLTIRTPGKMRVIGNVQLTGLSDTNALNLFADDALEVILGQGTVRLLGANNAPGGVLNMQSDDIIVATAAAITDVGNATSIDAINTRLGENDGIILDEGALFARRIAFDIVGGVYVQNSGTGTAFGERRGLTFGAGGLDVVTEGPSRIVLNGVHLGPNGQVTGLDTIPLLTIAGSPVSTGGTTGSTGSLGFDPLSTLNGCVIANSGSCTIVTFDSMFPVQDVIDEDGEDDGDGDQGDGTTLPAALITMRDLDPLTGEPLLDDPVTGAGNDDLWTPTLDTCDPASAGGSCPAAE